MAQRRITLYFSWSRTREVGAPLGELDNRFPALFELRRAAWPHFEWAADRQQFSQEVDGFLDHVVLADFASFRTIAAAAAGKPVTVWQREGPSDSAGPIDNAMLDSTDTLIVVSLDHMATEQAPSSDELAGVTRFLQRPGTCLIVCPHHDVGKADSLEQRLLEQQHHGDRLVPSRQRLSGYGRGLLAGLGFPIENQFGLSPAATPDGTPAQLRKHAKADELGLLRGVDTFNLHPHLPHFHVPPAIADRVRVLASQKINPFAPAHGFRDTGRDSFDALLWIPPEDTRRGHVLVCDATLWSSAFGGLPSLQAFWNNVASMA